MLATIAPILGTIATVELLLIVSLVRALRIERHQRQGEKRSVGDEVKWPRTTDDTRFRVSGLKPPDQHEGIYLDNCFKLPELYKATCEGGFGGKCTQPDCEVCWPDNITSCADPNCAGISPRSSGIVEEGSFTDALNNSKRRL